MRISVQIFYDAEKAVKEMAEREFSKKAVTKGLQKETLLTMV
jgi:hypothetical protein